MTRQRLLKSFLILVTLSILVVSGFGQKGSEMATRSGHWAPASSLGTARQGACSVPLPDGTVLIAGGVDARGSLSSTELYGSDGRFTAAAPMAETRSAQSCAAVQGGMVLMAGGTAGGSTLNSAEVYTVITGKWSPVGSMTMPRSGAAASSLRDGRILITGGQSFGVPTATVEMYDPATRSFQTLPTKMSSPRQQHAAVSLGDGRVMIAGGSDGQSALDTIDMYDPKVQAIYPVGRMSVPRQGLSATVMLDGRVFLAGGHSGTADLASAEIFDPKTGTIASAGSMVSARQGHLSFRLPDNNGILLVGGTQNDKPLDAAEVYIPWTGAFKPIDALSIPRSGAVGAPLQQKGSLLVAGGLSAKAVTATAEAFAFNTITTDRSVYLPGQTATITGSRWSPGETVQIVRHGVSKPDLTLTAVADSGGNIVNSQLQLDAGDIGVSTLTAKGEQSGSGAQGTLTTTQTSTSVIYTPGTPTTAVPLAQIETVTGTVTAAAANPTCGTLDFYYGPNAGTTTGATLYGSVDLSTLTPPSNSATQQINTSTLGVGTFYFVVVYDPSTCSSNPDGYQTSITDGKKINVSSLTLTKTPNPATYSAVGQTITYTYVITNNGNVALGPAQFTISDDHIGSPLGTPFPCGPSNETLAAGGTVSCTAPYQITQGDLDAGFVTNTATASGAGFTSDKATATVTGTQNKAISLAKTASPSTYNALNQTITYSYVITNIGNVTLGPAQFTISDDHIGSPLGTPFACGPSNESLAPGGTVTCTATYQISQGDLDSGTVKNTATASGAGLTSSPASATIIGTQTKSVSFTKTANPTTYSAVGQTITYTYTITNNSNVTLSGPFSISDNKLGTISPCGAGPLAPGVSTSCTATHAITQADLTAGSIVNIATASGNGVTSNQATATVTAVIVTGGPITTYTQGGWGSEPHGGNPGALLAANFAKVYPNGVTIGGGFTLTFTKASAVAAFLPQGGTPGALTKTAVDPTSSSANVFGGQVLALELSVDFSGKGITASGLGGLHLTSGPLAGQTVAQVLAEANQALGGGALPQGMTIANLNDVVDKINNAFDNGVSNGYVK